MDTFFASPERTSDDDLRAEIAIVNSSPVLDGLLHTVGGLLAVLDENRQVVALNESFLGALGVADPVESLGLRLGEVMQCSFAQDGPAGCGTTRYCSSCGAAIAMVTALGQNRVAECVCALRTERDGLPPSLTLSVRACPIRLAGRCFLLVFLQDITANEQRAALERTFFHDIGNMLHGLVGASEVLLWDKADPDLPRMVYEASSRLAREVEIQKYLLWNGQNSLRLEMREATTGMALEEVRAFYASHRAAHGRDLVLPEPLPDTRFRTDLSILMRVLCNMVTNALEATPDGGTVRVWTEEGPGKVAFCVWNQTVIAPEAALRMFQRSYSTKEGAGRGMGTYSMKLFGEQLLGGEVGFTSSPEEGTVFRISLPA